MRLRQNILTVPKYSKYVQCLSRAYTSFKRLSGKDYLSHRIADEQAPHRNAGDGGVKECCCKVSGSDDMFFVEAGVGDVSGGFTCVILFVFLALRFVEKK